MAQLEMDEGRNHLFGQIADLEWPMFQSINGASEKAVCQQDRDRFIRMRNCQYACWSIEHLESWLADLLEARKSGRNLPEEKYIRMMEFTHPGEFARLGTALPQVDEITRQMIAEIVSAHVEWKRKTDALYPALTRRGRPLENDSEGQTSFATYLRAELHTCSPRTIAIYHADTMQRIQDDQNEVAANLQEQVQLAGFKNLESAESYFERND